MQNHLVPFATTVDIADALGVQSWRVARLFELGILPEPPRASGRRLIPKSMVPTIADALRKGVASRKGGGQCLIFLHRPKSLRNWQSMPLRCWAGFDAASCWPLIWPISRAADHGIGYGAKTSRTSCVVGSHARRQDPKHVDGRPSSPPGSTSDLEYPPACCSATADAGWFFRSLTMDVTA